MNCPKCLSQYALIWTHDHKQAELAWFADAKYGLFLHYGLYSLMHGPEWAMK